MSGHKDFVSLKTVNSLENNKIKYFQYSVVSKKSIGI